jgi:hypothetical protein
MNTPLFLKPLRVLLIFVMIFSTDYVKAQLIHRDLLQKASVNLNQLIIPQARFKPFPQTPGGWKKVLPDSVIKKIIIKGEAALGKEFKNIPATVMLEFVRTGNRTNYESMCFTKRNQLWDLIMAEAVEGRGRFADKIVNGIWSISEESFWGISAHSTAQKAGAGLPDVEDPIVDLFAAETSAILAWADYLVGPQLDKVLKLVRPRIHYEIDRRVLKPMRTKKFDWMGGGNTEAKLNNWAPWITSNYIATVLLMEGDAATRREDIGRSLKILDQYMDGLGVDGGCDEGPSYWEAAGGCVYDALNLLYDSTDGKLNIYNEPFVKQMATYIYKTNIADNYFVNVADAHPRLNLNSIMVYRFGKDVQSTPMAEFGSWVFHNFKETEEEKQFRRTRSLYDLLAIKACAASVAKENPLNDAWFSDVQLMLSRSENGLFVATHGGTNGESHNHNDVGDFMVYADGYPVIIDVGSGVYTARTFSKDRYTLWFNTSPYHNLPTINGQEQAAGLKFAANDVRYQADNKSSSLVMNIAKSYPGESDLKAWYRSVKMNKNQGIEIDDHYQTNILPKSLTQSFMTICDLNLSTPGKIVFLLPNQRNVYLNYDVMKWNISKERIELTTPEDQGFKSTWDGKTIWRLLLTSKLLKKEDSTRYYIYR